MTAIRQDAWSEEDDLILAEVTLRHIREAALSSPLSKKLVRRSVEPRQPAASVGIALSEKKYEAAIQIAKAQRQKRNQQRKHTAHLLPWRAALSQVL